MNKSLNYKIETLEKMLDRKYATILVYLDRAEFQHIQIKTNKNGKFFSNVTLKDIEALKDMFERRQCNKYKK